VAFCQATPPPQPKAAAEPSAYCRSAAEALFEGSGDAEVATVWQRCKQGDTIAINAGAQGAVLQIGRLCDLTKPQSLDAELKRNLTELAAFLA
jgi:hypothetical protein